MVLGRVFLGGGGRQRRSLGAERESVWVRVGVRAGVSVAATVRVWVGVADRSTFAARLRLCPY